MSYRRYAIQYINGRRVTGGGVSGGNVLTGGGGPHAMDGPLHTNQAGFQKTEEKGVADGYAPLDGSGLVPEANLPPTSVDTLHTDSSVSGAHEIDLDDGNIHDLTLTGAATFTLAGTIVGYARLQLALRQDGTGGRTVTWPGSVSWEGDAAPDLQTAANAVDWLDLVTVDGGTSWFGFYGGGAALADIVEDETTFGLTSSAGTAESASRSDHTHGSPANPVTEATIRDAGRWEVIVSGSAPPVAVTNEAEDDWVVGWVSG